MDSYKADTHKGSTQARSGSLPELRRRTSVSREVRRMEYTELRIKVIRGVWRKTSEEKRAHLQFSSDYCSTKDCKEILKARK